MLALCMGVGSLTVGLLESSTGRSASELLRLPATRIGHQQSSVVLHEDVLDLLLTRLVHVCNPTQREKGDRGTGQMSAVGEAVVCSPTTNDSGGYSSQVRQFHGEGKGRWVDGEDRA